MSVNHS